MKTVKNYFFMDMGVTFGRSMRHIFRSTDTNIIPVAMMLLLVHLSGGAIQTGTENCINNVLPGLLLFALANTR